MQRGVVDWCAAAHLLFLQAQICACSSPHPVGGEEAALKHLLSAKRVIGVIGAPQAQVTSLAASAAVRAAPRTGELHSRFSLLNTPCG